MLNFIKPFLVIYNFLSGSLLHSGWSGMFALLANGNTSCRSCFIIIIIKCVKNKMYTLRSHGWAGRKFNFWHCTPTRFCKGKSNSLRAGSCMLQHEWRSCDSQSRKDMDMESSAWFLFSLVCYRVFPHDIIGTMLVYDEKNCLELAIWPPWKCSIVFLHSVCIIRTFLDYLYYKWYNLIPSEVVSDMVTIQTATFVFQKVVEILDTWVLNYDKKTCVVWQRVELTACLFRLLSGWFTSSREPWPDYKNL